MRPRYSIVGTLAVSRWFGKPWLRRIVGGVLIVLFVVLALFPHRYHAIATVVPTDPGSLGLGGALGQLGAANSVFNQQAIIEVGLRVAHSQDVRDIVIKRLDLIRRLHFVNNVEADRWLQDAVDVRLLRGGILLIESRNEDPVFAKSLVVAFYDAFRSRIGMINRAQTAYKRDILLELITTASERLARAQAAYDGFRRATKYSSPASSISAIGARIPLLQQAIKNKEVQLQSLRSFVTDDNMEVRQILAEVAALQTQLRAAENLGTTAGPYSVNRVVKESTTVQKLERELNIAQSLYDSYKRFLEGTALEDLTSLGNLRVIEPPTIETERVINPWPAGLAAALLLALLAIELYTIRPPIGAYREAA